MSVTVLYTNFFGKFLSNTKEISLNSGILELKTKDGNTNNINLQSITDLPVYKKSIFGDKITLFGNTKPINIGFLRRRDSKLLNIKLEEIIIDFLSNKIIISSNYFKQKTEKSYLRDSSIQELQDLIDSILPDFLRSKNNWKTKFNNEIISRLESFEGCSPLDVKKEEIRHRYETNRLAARADFYDSVEKKKLTKQQRLSVIRNNDFNLVLAAAGTGKTSVMVAKALDMIDAGEADNSEILLLAYNKKAAIELEERVERRGEAIGIKKDSMPKVSTYHALGRKILTESNISTSLSKLAEDDIALKIWVTQWLYSYMKSAPEKLQKIINLTYQPINPFDFKTKKEYDAYVRDTEYRTLQGEKVKSYQELLIANWFFLNCVDYDYEAPYVSKLRVEVGFDYKPDFHLKDSNIYIEHFGIDREGNTRAGIIKEEYNKIITQKRALHKEYETVLLETFHYDWVEGKLEERLESLMEGVGIKLEPRPDEEVLDVLKEMGFIDLNAERYLKCLRAIRVESLDEELILNRLKDKKITGFKDYTDLLTELHTSYIEELRRQNSIDFDDMIILATNAIKEGLYRPSWMQILVDEFQDISMARMNLLTALIDNGPSPALTVVGDDWQSIYRFSGGKLELTTRFEEYFGSHSLTKLDKTFRYNNNISDNAGMFIMENPEQYKKQITTKDTVDTPQVYLLDSYKENKDNLDGMVVRIVRKIRSESNGKIFILSRYNYLLSNAKDELKKSLGNKSMDGIDFLTFHGSKGLEAEYCILIGFFQGKSGFPNMNMEEAVVEALLPTLDTYPHSEERRLFYVALTRAEKKNYIIANPMATSDFVNEIMSPKYEIHIGSERFKEKYRKIFKCPLCADGYFMLKTGRYGSFYSCSTGSICKSSPRICEKCGAPSIDMRSKSICNNEACRGEKDICDRCGRPMVERQGKYGSFLGCTGYGIKDDQCKHTRKIL
jgi:DNA helicase-4